jgi:hypothetical protein
LSETGNNGNLFSGTCPRCRTSVSDARWCGECGLSLVGAKDASKASRVGRGTRAAVALVAVAIIGAGLYLVLLDGGPKKEIVPGKAIGPAELGGSIEDVVDELGEPNTDMSGSIEETWDVGDGTLSVSADAGDKITSITTTSSSFEFSGIDVSTSPDEAKGLLQDWTQFECGTAQIIVLNESLSGPSTYWVFVPPTDSQESRVSVLSTAGLEYCP